MSSPEISISSSVPTESVMQPLTALHLTRGVLASTINGTRGMHNAFVDYRTVASGIEMLSSREESEWAVAPTRFVTRADIRSTGEAVPALGEPISAGLL